MRSKPLHAERKPKGNPSYPAFLITQNQRRFYFATIPVGDLFQYCFVSSRDEDSTEGFQRALNKARAEDIAEYLSKGDGSIPTNIVLSAQESAGVIFDSRKKLLSFERVPKAFLVLDGQHRLWGYHLCHTKYKIQHRVPLAVFLGLSRAEEARLFIDINTKQRGVPAALLLDIKQVAHYEDAREQYLRELFDKLAHDPKSPLLGKLSSSKSARNKISRVTFNRAVVSILRSGILPNLDVNARYVLVRNYLNAFDAELKDKKLISRTVFFEAIFDVFDDVIRTTMSREKDAKQSSIQVTIRPLAQLDYSHLVNKGRRSVIEAMKAALVTTVDITEDML